MIGCTSENVGHNIILKYPVHIYRHGLHGDEGDDDDEDDDHDPGDVSSVVLILYTAAVLLLVPSDRLLRFVWRLKRYGR